MYEFIKEKKIILVGADEKNGSLTRYAIDIFKGNIVAIVDNDINKQGHYINDIRIEEVQKAVLDYKKNAFYVITTKKSYTSLEMQLESFGLERSKNYEYLFCMNDLFNPNIYSWYSKSLIKNGIYFPTQLRLELSSYCNLKCVYCRYHSTYYKTLPQGCNKNLSMEHLKQIINEANEIGTIREILNVQKGEMFCNPKWYEMLKYIRENIEIDRFHFSTNGMMLKKDAVDKLMYLNFPELVIVISIDGSSGNENDRLRIGANYKLIKNNIKYLIRHKTENTKVLIQNTQMLTNVIFDYYENNGFLKKDDSNYLLQDFGKDVEINTYATLATGEEIIDKNICEQENVFVKKVCIRQPVEGCNLPLDEIAIDSEGYVIVCGCEPWGELHRLGNIKNEKMIDIWNNGFMNDIREQYKTGNEVALCRHCISNALSNIGSKVFVKL